MTLEQEKRMRQLVDELNEHNRLYYVENSPKILDYDFDMLMKELENLEQETGVVFPDSPTQRVGSDLQTEFKEVERKRIMGSIANCYDREELKAWLEKYKGYEKILEPKYDGVSCSIEYENGVIKVAATRGSGYKGADITENVKTIKTVPLKIPVSVPVEIRGEILLPRSELKRINKEREEQGLDPFANERNAAAGSIKQLDTRITASRNLIFKPYGMYSDDAEFAKKNLTSQSHILLLAQSFGFSEPRFELFTNTEDVDAILDRFEENFLKTQDFCMDGCVIKINDYNTQLELGYTQKVPHWAKAFKFKQEQTSARLNDITLQMGMSGQISFVAELEPVYVDGSRITRATLNNVDFIKDNDIKIGDYLYISKGGAVIPRVDGVDYEKTLLSGSETKEFIEPTVCPFCGSPLSRKIDNGAHLYCTNNCCDENRIQRLIHFAKKECMNIDGLSEKNIRKLYSAGVVQVWQDFFKATPLDYYKAGVGKALSEKINENLNKSVELYGLDRTLYALGIPMIGKVSAEKIARKYKTMDAIFNAAMNKLIDVDGVGDVASGMLEEYMLYNADIIADAEKYLPSEYGEGDDSNYGDSLSGLKILATGTFKNFSRDGIKDSIIKNGGAYGSGVNKTLDYLIVGSEAGPSKLEKAKELGIKMINEDQYIDMIGGIQPVEVYVKVPASIDKINIKVNLTPESISLF